MIPGIAIVIPARSESAALGETLAVLDRPAGREGAEVLVCAAGDPAGIGAAVAGRARLLWAAGRGRPRRLGAGRPCSGGPAPL